jgi:2Fe-2S ferredoxin
MFGRKNQSKTTHKIAWPQLGRTIEAWDGQSILDAAIEADIPLDHACGGFCACTTCHITIVDGLEKLSPMDEQEKERLEGRESVTPASRLGCQTRVHGDVSVKIPGWE